ncbi:hypothetical protein C3K47_14770 [Solitalea longa]|uniref:ChbG/HpnK family deacetylase n=1 Tax=Solitalea longa TaxID=2079460 RepID=A0A2S5A0J4_9SPHI|nr:polysaccharide deacetylase family protein [Solitalea longa]POY35653.1 hypothetical protein C3K47_14770 [Solitalea longa]
MFTRLLYIVKFFWLSFCVLFIGPLSLKAQQTYAEKLGWKKGDRVLILHVDDAGMSFDSNQGTIEAIENGVANSLSVMMPCPWVPPMVKYIKENPTIDAGLHITLTSEWSTYRWGPVAGQKRVPGLTDKEGCLWRDVDLVRKHASSKEVGREIKAQIAKARKMGFNPTHLDSHMGTVFSKPGYLMKYMKIGRKENIPIMFPGGHNTMLLAQVKMHDLSKLKDSQFSYAGAQPVEKLNSIMKLARSVGRKVWNSGLPVLDDLNGMSYEWNFPSDMGNTDENLQKWFREQYEESLNKLKPGLTMVIMHCTKTTDAYKEFSGSGDRRKGDMLAMIDPKFRKFLEDEGFILTTWKEVMERRKSVGPQKFKHVNQDILKNVLFN